SRISATTRTSRTSAPSAATSSSRDLRGQPGPQRRGSAGAADDLAGLDARGAHVEPLRGAATGRHSHGLDVRVPAAVGPPVRVGHVVTEARPLATDVAHASHGYLLDLIMQRSAR